MGGKKIKIVIFWYIALLSVYRRYIEEIAKQNGVEVTLILPEYWPFERGHLPLTAYLFKKNFKKIIFDGKKINQLKIVQRKVFLSGKTIHFYPHIGKLLIKINPDIIYIFTEPHVAATAQIIYWRNCYSKNTKIIIESCENLDRKFNHFYEKWIYNYSLKNADGMVVMTTEIENLLRKNGYNGPIEIIGEGADPIKFKRYDSKSLRRKLGLNKHFVIGFCGRMTEEKGLLILIKAVSKLKKDFRLMIIGGGGEDFKKKAVELAKKLGVLDKIVWVGQVSGEKLPQYLSCFNLGVAPSLTTSSWKEQFGRFTGEFILCGVPIIGSSSSTVDEVLGCDAIMYKEDDVGELREKLEMIMDHPEIGRRLVRVGRKKVLSGFTNEKLAEKFVKFARRLVEKDL